MCLQKNNARFEVNLEVWCSNLRQDVGPNGESPKNAGYRMLPDVTGNVAALQAYAPVLCWCSCGGECEI